MTETAFESLLTALHSERDLAGARYVELRENLIKFFTWRGFSDAEEHADETMNRAARKLDAGEQVHDLRNYVFGIARLLCLEINRASARSRRSLAELPRVQSIANERETALREIRHQCLENCLRQLKADEKTFVIDYYQGARAAKIENRKELLAKSKLSASGLRMKALRLREKLETCVRSCCEQNEKNYV